MDYSSTFAISAAGMAVERARVEVAAMNLANASTVRAPGEAGYQPLRVVAQSTHAAPGPLAASFAAQVDAGVDGIALAGAILPQVAVEPTGDAPRLQYEPGHPLANEKGFVAYPAVDSAAEMVGLMSALRAYEANVAAMNASRSLAQKTLDLGGAQ